MLVSNHHPLSWDLLGARLPLALCYCAPIPRPGLLVLWGGKCCSQQAHTSHSATSRLCTQTFQVKTQEFHPCIRFRLSDYPWELEAPSSGLRTPWKKMPWGRSQTADHEENGFSRLTPQAGGQGSFLSSTLCWSYEKGVHCDSPCQSPRLRAGPQLQLCIYLFPIRGQIPRYELVPMLSSTLFLSRGVQTCSFLVTLAPPQWGELH